MGKLKIFDNINQTYIINFLLCELKTVNMNWIRFSVLVNIALLAATIYFAENKILSGVLSTVCIVLILYSYLYFIKRVEHNTMNLYIFEGIYMGLWCVSIGLFSYNLLKYVTGMECLGVIIILVFGSIAVLVISGAFYLRNIRINYYENYVEHFWKPIISGGFYGFTYYETKDFLFTMSVLLIIISILSAEVGVYFFLKAYCYTIVDRKELKDAELKRKSKNAKFNRYGKKTEKF